VGQWEWACTAASLSLGLFFRTSSTEAPKGTHYLLITNDFLSGVRRHCMYFQQQTDDKQVI
jgi:hypothetical protein